MSLPMAMVTGDLAFLNSSVSKISFKSTVAAVLLGTSTPTAALPGMGASMRTRGAARAKARSLERVVIRFTRTPRAGCSSYRVTTGPTE